MRQTVYKNHTIVHTGRPFSRYVSAGFVAAAAISWETREGSGDIHLFSLITLYPTEEEASTAALEEAKTWIDRHSLEIESLVLAPQSPPEFSPGQTWQPPPDSQVALLQSCQFVPAPS
jgi:hypothetical protein